jgi:secondary thiamine-phosphate synthase enzyme
MSVGLYTALMAVETAEIHVKTRGNNEVINITSQVASAVGDGAIHSGTVTVFVVGSTAGISTTEFEPGLVNRDLKAAFEGIAPEDGRYLHEETWHDDNGHSHVRATLLGPSVTIPLVDGRLTLGTWQQIILIDFDTRPRERTIIIQVVGE